MNGQEEIKTPFYKATWFQVVVILFVFFLLLVFASDEKENKKVDPPSYPTSSASYDELNTEVGCDSKYSEDKKKDIFESRYKNHWMKWSGRVFLAEADEVALDMNGVGIQDLQVHFSSENAGYELLRGDFITVKFVMKSAGGCFLPFSGYSAIIVK